MRSFMPVLIFLWGLALPAAAQTQAQGWYLGLDGGWTTLGAVEYGIASGPPATLDFGDSIAFGASVGYRFPIPLRLEADLELADYRLKTPTGFSSSAPSGGISAASFIASAAYDIPLSPQVSFSLGAGLGVSEVDPSIRDPLGNHLHDSQAVFTWRLSGGLTMALGDNLELAADYRYQEIGDSSHGFSAGNASLLRLGAKQMHMALISLRWFVAPQSSFEPVQVSAVPSNFPYGQYATNGLR
jgi:opacity protein-like surface antigen